MPVEFVSAHPNTKSNIILKLANTRGFFLVDTRGKFYNRKKLESMITFRTNFVSPAASLLAAADQYLMRRHSLICVHDPGRTPEDDPEEADD